MTLYERALKQSMRLKGTKYEIIASLVAFKLIDGKETKKLKYFVENLEKIKKGGK